MKYLLSICLLFSSVVMANNEYGEEVRQEKLEFLFRILRDNNIRMEPLFFRLLAVIPHEISLLFYEKAAVFFYYMHYSAKSTDYLTIMLHENQQHIHDFCLRDEDDIIELVHKDTISCFSVMYNGRGLPAILDVRRVLDWQYWKNINDEEFDQQLFQAFADFHSGGGCPTEYDVELFLAR